MKTILMIHGYGKAQERIERHWPWYLKSGCDIFGIDRLNGRVIWPTERLVGFRAIGMDGYPPHGDIVELFLGTLETFLQEPLLEPYEACCITEHDAIFVRPLPRIPVIDHDLLGLCVLVAHPAGSGGGKGSGFIGTKYYHNPWIMNRSTAAELLVYGRRLVRLGLTEHGFSDRFIGLMHDIYDFNIAVAPAFSVNTIDRPEYLEAARKAIAEGACYVHGIKTVDQLKAVTAQIV